MTKKLSAVITVHNSQDFIVDCLESLSFADEIIVIDNESKDNTVEISKKMGAKVFTYKNNPEYLNESKNYGFSKASGDWIVSIDSDERVEPELQKEIEIICSEDNSKFSGYQIPRHNQIFGKVISHGLWYPDYQIRLFQKGKGIFPNRHNHELLNLSGSMGTLSGHIFHLNYQSVSQYLQKIDKTYSDNEANTFIKQKKKLVWSDALLFPSRDFLSNYFFRKGYKDGLHGLVLSLLQAFYMFIVFAKIWEKQGFKSVDVSLDQTKKVLAVVSKETKYWFVHEQIKSTNPLRRLLLKFYSSRTNP